MVNFPQIDTLVAQGLTVEEACEHLGLNETEREMALAVVKVNDPKTYTDKVKALKFKMVETLATVMECGEPLERLRACEITSKLPTDFDASKTEGDMFREKMLRDRLIEIEQAHIEAEKSEEPRFNLIPA